MDSNEHSGISFDSYGDQKITNDFCNYSKIKLSNDGAKRKFDSNSDPEANTASDEVNTNIEWIESPYVRK